MKKIYIAVFTTGYDTFDTPVKGFRSKKACDKYCADFHEYVSRIAWKDYGKKFLFRGRRFHVVWGSCFMGCHATSFSDT